jgi:hypothetical protein
MVLQLRSWTRGQPLLTLKHWLVMKCHTGSWNSTDSLERPRQQKMNMRFVTWNVRGLYRAGSLKTVASELAKYKLDIVAV